MKPVASSRGRGVYLINNVSAQQKIKPTPSLAFDIVNLAHCHWGKVYSKVSLQVALQWISPLSIC